MTTPKKITVAMSERSPLRIDPELWPLIASADWFNGEHECQANYIRRIKVREHADGRRIVYGLHTSGNGGVAIGFRGASGGYLVEPKKKLDMALNETSEIDAIALDIDTIRAIRRVAGIIGDDELGSQCVADLPAQDLT